VSKLFQFDGPVGVVEELLPAFVSLMAQMNVDEGVVAGSDWLFYQGHTGLFWGVTALFDVAGGTGTNDVLPGGFAAEAAGDDVVER